MSWESLKSSRSWPILCHYPNMHEGSEKIHEDFQSGRLVRRVRFQSGIKRL